MSVEEKKLKRKNCFDVNGAKEDDFGVREVCDGVLLRSPTYSQNKLRHEDDNLILKKKMYRKKKVMMIPKYSH
jgi:hypothetical protein